jgi:MraZ protein
MFLGQYERNLDGKSRLAIPSEMRAGLGDDAILTRGFDNCLCIYPAAKWSALVLAMEHFSDVRAEARTLARGLFGSAVPCAFDGQGRVTIPVFLREHAGLNGDAVVVGVNTHVEIWGKEAWIREQQTFETKGSRLAESLTASSA